MRVLLPFAAITSLVHAVTIPSLLGRTPTDSCASLNTELVVPDLLGILTAVGVIDACVCISDLPVFLQTNVVGILAVTIAGEQVVTDILTNLIYGAAPECHHPTNSVQNCVNGNPCGFTCTNGFNPSPPANPTDCVCEPPKKVCNGVCVANAPSSIPTRRDVIYCDHGFTPCGTTGSKAYECVNTQTNLESCGGCSIPLDAYSPKGTDCSTIPGVSGVSCNNAACVVHECMPDYTLSYDKGTCYKEDAFSLAKEAVRKYRIASGFI